MHPLLNPQIFPSTLSKSEHARRIKTSIAAVVVLAIIGIIYCIGFVLSEQPQTTQILVPPHVEPVISEKQRVINELQMVYTTTTDIQKDAITKTLSQTKTKVATSTKAAIINKLK